MSTTTKTQTRVKPLIWHAHPTHQPTLFFTTQAWPGWTPAHRGSYILLFPSWYRMDGEGKLHRIGLTAIPSEKKAAAIVKSWREDLEGLLCRTLEDEVHAIRAQLPFTILSQCACIMPDPLHFFLPEVFVLVGAYLYPTNQRGQLLQALRECSARTIETLNDFERMVQQLIGSTQEIRIHQREKVTPQVPVATHTRMRIPHHAQLITQTVRKKEHKDVPYVSFPLSSYSQ